MERGDEARTKHMLLLEYTTINPMDILHAVLLCSSLYCCNHVYGSIIIIIIRRVFTVNSSSCVLHVRMCITSGIVVVMLCGGGQ